MRSSAGAASKAQPMMTVSGTTKRAICVEEPAALVGIIIVAIIIISSNNTSNHNNVRSAWRSLGPDAPLPELAHVHSRTVSSQSFPPVHSEP